MRARSLRLAAAALAAFVAAPALAQERVVPSGNGACQTGPHDPSRVARLPAAPATSHRPRNPSEESYLHCQEPDEGARDRDPGVRLRR